jgi:hypothetical protein
LAGFSLLEARKRSFQKSLQALFRENLPRKEHLIMEGSLAWVLWGVCLTALLPVFYALLSRQTKGRHQECVLGAGNSVTKAAA